MKTVVETRLRVAVGLFIAACSTAINAMCKEYFLYITTSVQNEHSAMYSIRSYTNACTYRFT